jgi:hypothetical protein
MTTIMVVNNDYITVEYYLDKAQISHTIHKPVSGQPFRDALNAGTDVLIKNGAYKWLSDDRKNGPLTVEDRQWGFNDWNMRAIQAGWKYWALVVPTEVINAGTLTQTIVDLSEKGLRVMAFKNVEDAQDWLDRF